jgi:hypothetical protein
VGAAAREKGRPGRVGSGSFLAFHGPSAKFDIETPSTHKYI